jgi:hypothetical protein
MRNNWTPQDVDLAAFLTDNAARGWTLHIRDNDGQPA